MVKYTLACGLQECLGNEWTGDIFKDFRIMVDGSEYFCHKFILSACSTFFNTLLRADFKEKQEGYVVLNKISKETFDVIINAIYKGVDGLTLGNVGNVWQATHLLDIPFLIQESTTNTPESWRLHLTKLLMQKPSDKIYKSQKQQQVARD
ncbi:kelch-like protein 24 [Physella acuta]|uniref:kelch-like protein 24 n=1 Tax=Physella acuta TaxID=109671 RepID=UPI0027DE79EF|nr:kelch-like protein 24 [Physella acuta]